MIRAPLQSLKLNSVEDGWTGRNWSNTWSLVGRPEGFIGGSVLVNGPGWQCTSLLEPCQRDVQKAWLL